jgi:hypothetical protein
MSQFNRPKYQVFVSSTYEDLRDERESATWSVMKLGHIATGMETFTAKNDRGWETITATIDNSDYYLLIIAGRYGEIDPTWNESWTEHEYEYARAKGIPILVFLRNDDSITVNKAERNRLSAERLERFIQKIKDRHLCKRWSTKEHLGQEISVALTRQIEDDTDKQRDRPGWFRGPLGKDVAGYYHGLSEFKDSFHGYSYASLLKDAVTVDLLPDLPSFISRVCSSFAPGWGVLRTRLV